MTGQTKTTWTDSEAIEARMILDSVWSYLCWMRNEQNEAKQLIQDLEETIPHVSGAWNICKRHSQKWEFLWKSQMGL